MAITLFCGVAVPVSFWPGWLEVVANFLPVTHGLHAIRLLLASGPGEEIALNAAYELIVGLGWLCVGALIIDRMADGGRRDGSIELI
jgi:ABC-2 type transport system permease protein